MRSLPVGLGALALLGGALLLLANLGLQAVGHPPMKLVPSLGGVTRPDRPDWSLAALLDGAPQAALARMIGREMPLYPWAVRARNQVAYSAFDSSAVPAVAVGRGGALFEQVYAQDWCTRDLAAFRAPAARWAARLREMQDAVERRGHVFIYVLTPSKVAQYPAILPHGYECPAAAADQQALVPAWVAAVRAAGVHVADTVAALSAAHDDYPFPLYPAGGAHWDAVGAAIGQRTILAALDAQAAGRGLAPEPFTWRMAPHPRHPDNDLASLLNLFTPAGDGPVPVVEPGPSSGPCRATVAIVGGSFSQWTVQELAERGCRVVQYQYWRAYTVTFEHGELAFRPGADPARRAADLRDADVVIYEENEASLPAPDHGLALWEFLRQQ